MNPEKQKFFEQLKGAAMEQQIKYGVPSSVTLAQAWIEHGNYSKDTNNYFGIHDDNHYWRNHGGKTVKLNDNGKMSHFRIYKTLDEGIEDHSKFFLVNQRYAKCLAVSPNDPDYGKKWAQGICEAGYAERPKNDPNRYARMIIADIKEYHLDEIDRQANVLAAQRGTAVGYMRGQAKNTNYVAQQSAAPTATTVADVTRQHFRMPVDDVNLQMTSGFGMRIHPITKQWSQHNGIDISMPSGTQLFSTEDRGVVKRVNWGVDKNGDGYADLDAKGNPIINGKCVEVEYKHGNDTYTVQYLHMSRVDVQVGQTVDHNTLLGLSGDTGRGTGAHLHYGVMKNGTYINPVTYLADIAVLSESSAKIKDMHHGASDVLGIEKQKVNMNELLAHKASLDHIDMPGRDFAQNQQGNQVQQGGDAMQQPLNVDALVQQFGQANDPLQMLSYMMQQQNIQGSSEGFLSNMISSLFKAAMLLAVQLQTGNGQEPVEQAEQDAGRTPEQQKLDAVMRRRDTPDVEKARQMASMSFDAESPEQQQNAGVRLT